MGKSLALDYIPLRTSEPVEEEERGPNVHSRPRQLRDHPKQVKHQQALKFLRNIVGYSRWKWVASLIICLSIVTFLLRSHGFLAEKRKSTRCNPFKQSGYLHFNATYPPDNTWRPFDEACPPSSLYGILFNTLKGPAPLKGELESVDELSWLRNRTVVLIGDSVDRLLMRDFCGLLDSVQDPVATHYRPANFSDAPTTPRVFQLGRESPLSPPVYYYNGGNLTTPPDEWPIDHIDEYVNLAQSRTRGNRDMAGPKVCYLPTHDFMLMHISSWGLAPSKGGYVFRADGAYHPPHKLIDRVEHNLKPALASMAHHLRRPNTVKPDIVHLCSGFRDLKEWSAEDFEAAHETPTEQSDTPYVELSPARLDRFQKEFIRTLKGLAQSFPDPSVPIMWRTYSRPDRHAHVPYSRVQQLDDLTRYILQDLIKHDLKLGPRLLINDWGRKYRGQEYHQRDHLHPNTLPGAILWANIVLWELRELVEGGKHR